MRDNLTCETVKIAQYDPTIQGTEAKMVLLGNAMGESGGSWLMACLAHPGEWVSIDEIGFLEETCPEFQSAIRRLMKKKRVAMMQSAFFVCSN
jgi:nucleoside-triphosphatase THEP1